MIKQFDIEEKITGCWSICDDLDFVIEAVEGNDEARDMLIGLKALYHAKFEKLWNSFEASLN